MAGSALQRYESLLAKGGGTAAWAGTADALARELKDIATALRVLHIGDRSGHCTVCVNSQGGRRAWPCPTLQAIGVEG